MSFEKDEFNEYGVRTNFQQNTSNSSKNKTPSSPKLSLIVVVTVLFSVFNFIVGYMIGKFMSNSAKEVDIASTTTHPNDVLGLPSSKQSFSEQKNKFREEFISEDEEITDLIPTSFESNKNTLLETKTEKSVEKQSRENKENVISRKKEESTKLETKTKIQDKKQVVKNEKKEVETKSSPSSNVKYFIQVSSNERKDVAESNLSKLKSIGISGFIQETTIDGKKLFRVRVGGFESYDEATKILEKARRINQSAFLVVSK